MKEGQYIDILGELREPGGKSSVMLRKQKRIPAVFYSSRKIDNIYLSVLESDVEKILSSPTVKLQSLKIGKNTYKTLLKDVSYHPVTDSPLHVDFYELVEGTKLKLSIPIKYKGIPRSVLEKGGRFQIYTKAVKMEVLIENIPSTIDIDVVDMDLGQVIYCKDIQSDKYRILEDLNRKMAIVKHPKGSVDKK